MKSTRATLNLPIKFTQLNSTSLTHCELSCDTDNIKLLTLSFVKLEEHVMHKLFELNLR